MGIVSDPFRRLAKVGVVKLFLRSVFGFFSWDFKISCHVCNKLYKQEVIKSVVQDVRQKKNTLYLLKLNVRPLKIKNAIFSNKTEYLTSVKKDFDPMLPILSPLREKKNIPAI